MKYILNKDIALRSWIKIPYAAYIYKQPFIQTLSKEECELLQKCDGKTDLEESSTLNTLCQKSYCTKAEEGDELTGWQKMRVCNNRYFPRACWSITGRCNYNCKHCFMACDNTPTVSEFTLDQCMRMLDEFEQCGIQEIEITGGEPMLHPHFMTILEECAKRRIVVAKIPTNASLITRELLEQIKALGHNPMLEISFDGIGHHDWMRGVNGAEEKTLASIKLCKEMEFPTWVNICIHRGNLDTIRPTMQLMDQIGINIMRVLRTSEVPRWSQNGKDFCLGIHEYADIALKIIKDCIEDNVSFDVRIWRFANFNCTTKSYDLIPLGKHNRCCDDHRIPCLVTRQMVSITPDGDVVPCNQASGQMKSDGLFLGNVHETSLQSTLRDGAYIDCVTTTLKQIRDKNVECQECEWSDKCKTCCTASSIIFTKRFDSYDPTMCVYFKCGYMDKSLELFQEAGFH